MAVSVEDKEKQLLSKVVFNTTGSTCDSEKLARMVLGMNASKLAARTEDPDGVAALARRVLGEEDPPPPQQGAPDTSDEGDEGSDSEENEGKGKDGGGDPGDDDAAASDDPVSEGSAEGTMTRDDLEQMTKAELQDTAVQLGIAKSGNVATLFKRITDFLDI